MRYVDLALLTSLFTGAISVAMGILKLGYAVTFISPSVITGFTTGTALVIAQSQLESLLGVKASKSDYAIVQLINIFRVIGDTKWLNFVNGVVCISMLIGLKRLNPRLPGALIVTVLTAVCGYLIHRFSELGFLLPIVGTVPSGLPSFYVPLQVLNSQDIVSILFPSALLALIGFMQSIAISIKFTGESGNEVNPSQELFALGMAHILGSLFQSPDSTGGFSRSAVNKTSGAKTQLSNIVAGTVILVALVGLTPLFYHIPKSTLSAIVITAVLPLIEPSKYPEMYKHKPSDAVVACLTALLTLLTTIQLGLGMGIVISVIVILQRTSRPHNSVLGEVDTQFGKAWRNIKRYKDAKQYPFILVWRFDADLWFGNVRFWRDQLLRHVSSDIRFLILDFGSVNDVDLTGAQAVVSLVKNVYDVSQVRVLFTNVKGPVRDTFWKMVGGISDYQSRVCTKVKVQVNDDVEQSLDTAVPLDEMLPGGKIVKEMFFFNVHCAVSYATMVTSTDTIGSPSHIAT